MRSRTIPLWIVAGTLSLVAFAWGDLPPQELPVYGGSGGSAFGRNCGQGRVLTGLRYRSGVVLDAIGLLCRPVLSNGTLGPETTVGTLAGGGGGNSDSRDCGPGNVVAGANPQFGTYVSSILLLCAPWHASSRSMGQASASQRVGDYHPFTTDRAEDCESSAQPAHAIRGRSGAYIDAFGLICDEP